MLSNCCIHLCQLHTLVFVGFLSQHHFLLLLFLPPKGNMPLSDLLILICFCLENRYPSFWGILCLIRIYTCLWGTLRVKSTAVVQRPLTVILDMQWPLLIGYMGQRLLWPLNRWGCYDNCILREKSYSDVSFILMLLWFTLLLSWI